MCTNADKAEMDHYDLEDYTSEDDAKAMLELYIETFGRFFDERKKKFIIDLIKRGFEDENNAFISEPELNSMIINWLKINTNWSENIYR